MSNCGGVFPASVPVMRPIMVSLSRPAFLGTEISARFSA
jgi:hypothetical protein